MRRRLILAGLLLPWLPRARAWAQSPALSPEAELLLRRAAQTLSQAHSLALDLEVLREVTLEAGRVVSLASSTGIALRRPDALRASIRGDATMAEVIYDGRRVVVHAVDQKGWAETPAPPSIDALLPMLQQRLGLPLDIGDLLVSDPYAALSAGTAGEVVSPSVVNGIPVWHLLLRSGEVAWEVWLRQDASALPVMAVVVRDGLRTLYRFEEWRLDPVLDAALFRFTPPAGAMRIPMVFRQEGEP